MGRVTVKPVAVGSDEEKSGDSLMREHHPGSTNGLPDTGSSPLPGSGSPVAARCFSGRPQDRSPGPLDRLGRTEKKSSGTGASTTPAYGLRVRSSRDGRRQQKKDRIAQKMVDSDVHDPLLPAKTRETPTSMRVSTMTEAVARVSSATRASFVWRAFRKRGSQAKICPFLSRIDCPADQDIAGRGTHRIVTG